MGFRVGAYAKVWSVERFEKYTKVNLSVSRKSRDTGEYETDFSGFVNLIGIAHTNAENLEANDRIKILDCDVTTRYDKKRNEKFTNYTMYNWEPAGTTSGESPKDTSKPVTKAAPVEETDDDELPF